MTHICVSKVTIIGSDNGLSPGRRQAIIWTNAGILLIGILGTNLSEFLTKIYIFSFKKMHLKISSGNWCPFCLGLNVPIRVLRPNDSGRTRSIPVALCDRNLSYWILTISTISSMNMRINNESEILNIFFSKTKIRLLFHRGVHWSVADRVAW